MVASERPRPSLQVGETDMHGGFSRLPTGREGRGGFLERVLPLGALGSGT